MTPTVLLTGFEPFGGESVNPSWQIAAALDGWHCEGHGVRAVRLSCVFGQALAELDAAIAAHAPALAHARGGFVHVPFTPEQTGGKPGVPAMALETQVEGIRHALRSAILIRDDVRETAGREH